MGGRFQPRPLRRAEAKTFFLVICLAFISGIALIGVEGEGEG